MLDGADMLIGNMGGNIRVGWSGAGLSYTDVGQRIVALDYGPLETEDCPFPGAAVDEVMGYAAHEGGHCLWSVPGARETIQLQLKVRWAELPAALRDDFSRNTTAVLSEACRVQNLLEDAHIDRQVAQKWPVLGQYVRVARTRLLARKTFDLEAMARAAPSSRSALVNLWAAVALYGCPLPCPVPGPVQGSIHALMALTDRAIHEKNSIVRQHLAVDAAILLWERVPSPPTAPPSVPPLKTEGAARHGDASAEKTAATDGAQSGDALDDFDPCTASPGGGRQVVPVPKQLLARLSQASDERAEDLSPSVARMLSEEPGKVTARARAARYDPALAHAVIYQVGRQIREIQQAFRRRQDESSGWVYGLDRGRLDGRRLWKLPLADRALYKRREAQSEPSLAIGLLLDVSASMSRHMTVVQQAAAVFSQGLGLAPGIDLIAWCYSGQGSSVGLTRVYDRQSPRLSLANLEQGGWTPSGAAIAEARLLMGRMRRKTKLLIHFTDGQPDRRDHLMRAIEECRQAGIQVYAVGLPRHREMLASQYGEGNYETIETVTELPQAMVRVLKRLGGCHGGEISKLGA